MTSESSQDYKDQKAAIKSYLQLCEFRLSTMRLIAGLFLNGAGLLILFPVLFKDAFIQDFFWSIQAISENNVISLGFSLSILCSVIVSFIVSILSLYNLLRDIALFYFRLYIIRFYDGNDRDNEELHNSPFGFPEGSELRLVEEADQMEASLVRNSIFLRRLVLRYLKSLLILVWTIFIAFIVSQFLDDKNLNKQESFSNACYALAIYMLWFLLTPIIVKLPIQWIQSYAEKSMRIREHYRDPELVKFEKLVRRFCGFSCFIIAGLLVVFDSLTYLEVFLILAFIFIGALLLFRWDENFWVIR